MPEIDENSSYFTINYFPKITIGLILVNILVFVSVLLFNNTHALFSEKQVFTCLKINHPECLTTVSQDKYTSCAVNLFREYKGIPQSEIPYEQCQYTVNLQCVFSSNVIKTCASPSDRLVFNLGLVPTQLIVKPWSIITSMFMHANWSHILNNMFGLLLVGMFVEARIHNSKKYLLLYFLSGLGSAFLHVLFNSMDYTPLIGASGAIFGLMGANLVLNFYHQKTNYIPHLFGPFSFKGFSVPYLVLIFILQIMYSFTTGSSIAYIAHVGGFITGAILGVYFRDKDDFYSPQPIRN